jgi:hypothetical protein
LEHWRREDRWLIWILKLGLVVGVLVAEAVVLLAIGRLLL